MSITFPCSQCGQRYQVDESLTGKRMKCKKCETVMKIPASNPSAPTRPPLQTFGTAASPAPPPPKPAARRPAPPPPADRFTIDDVEDPYGLDSAPLPSVAPKPMDDWDDELLPARATIARAKPSSSKSKGSRSDGDVMDAVSKWTAIVGCGALGVFILLTLIGVFVIPYRGVLLLGMVMSVVALLVAMVMIGTGAIWGLVLSFMESALCGLLYLFLPFYGLYYIITRWDEMRRPVLLNLAGAGLLLATAITSSLAFPAIQKVRAINAAGGRRAGAVPPWVQQPARLRPGMTPEQQRAELDRFRNEREEHIKGQLNRRPNARPRPQVTPEAQVPAGPQNPPAAARVPAPPPQVARVEPRARFRPGGGQGVATPAAGQGLAMAGWKVQADPAPEPISFPAGQPLNIPIPEMFGNDDVVYPSTPSPFVALGGNGDERQRREVWDLRDGKRVGGLIGRLDL
ncbi:MAG: hypothetical protein ABI353_01050, partial [Isosphaeraceae bacterium]